MTIAKKLALLVFVSVFGLLSAGGFAVWKMGSMQDTFGAVVSQSLPAMAAVSKVSDGFKDTRALLLALLMEEDEDLRAGFAQKVQEARTEINDGLNELHQVPGAEQTSEQLTALLSEYSSAVNGTVAKTDNLAAAQMDLYTKVIPIEEKLDALLLESRQQQQQQLHETVNVDASRAIYAYGVAVLVGLVLMAALGVTLRRSVMGPLTTMTKGILRVAHNMDFTQKLPVISQDEMGEAATATNHLLESVRKSLREIVDSTKTLTGATVDLREVSTNIESVAKNASSASGVILESVKQVNDNIAGVSDRTDHAATLARESGEAAESGGETIGQMIVRIEHMSDTVCSAANSISHLQEQVENVSSVVQVIREVADQTNLLALNAAIEAARAGESGRGFAVVADEVRKLAERTSTSTQQIEQVIHQIQEGSQAAVSSMQAAVQMVREGGEAAGEARQALTAIRDGSIHVRELVEEIVLGVSDQRAATERISTQFASINEALDENDTAASRTSASVGDLEELAGKINKEVQKYRI